MRIVVLAESWPVDDAPQLSAVEVATRVADAWEDAAPTATVAAFALGDGGPRSADALAGRRFQVGGADALETSEGIVLAPADGHPRWNPHALATALLGLAAEHAGEETARRVIVPAGDVAPAGDATDLWVGGLSAMRAGIAALDVVVAVSSQRPLLGFHGMSAAVRDGREHDPAIAEAAQQQENRWSTIALEVDPIAQQRTLMGATRLSDQPGTGAAGGLAYCLAAAGARLSPASPLLATLAGADAEVAEAGLVVAIVPALEPRTLDEGAVPAASRLAATTGVPCAVLAPRVRIGRRDLMNAGVASAHEGAHGADGLVDAVRRMAHTWSPR